jgi:hypothetical protein
MKRTNILWLALIALVLYIAMNSRSTAQVQQGPSNIRVHEVTDGLRQGSDSGVKVSGRIVGFSCVQPGNSPRCYVATTD